MTTATMVAAVAILQHEYGADASLEYPGYIRVGLRAGEREEWAFGDVNTNFGGHRVDHEGEALDGTFAESSIPSNCRDAGTARAVAEWIALVVTFPPTRPPTS